MATNKNDSIIIFNELSLVQQRINNLLQDYDIHVYEASYGMKSFNLLSDNKLNIRLIILGVGNDVDKAFDVLSKIKEKKPDIPILILSSNTKRETVKRGILEGVSDYIMKPFDDDYLLERILSLLNTKRKDNLLQIDLKSEIVFDVQSYLTTELKKAEKGKYEITVIMCTFDVPADEFNAKVAYKYRQVSELFCKMFKSILWDTDIFVRYGPQTFIGVFPFCGLTSMDKIKKKIIDSFEDVKKVNKVFTSFHLTISTITYPSETKDPKELLLTLGLRMQNEIDEKFKDDIEISSNNDTKLKVINN